MSARARSHLGIQAAAFGWLSVLSVVHASDIVQHHYLKASNAEAADRFGHAVAIDGDTLLIGASEESGGVPGVDGDDTDNTVRGAGAAYVLVREEGEWVHQAYLKASNPDENDHFGWAVAISGDTAVVSSRLESSGAAGVNGDSSDNSLPGTGAVYVFVRDPDGRWTQEAYLKPSNPGVGGQFGGTVAISGDTIVVGSATEDGDASGAQGEPKAEFENSGAAYLFVRNNGVWAQQAYLKSPVLRPSVYFGSSVAISGNTLLIGASSGYTDDGGLWLVRSGAAYVFTRDGNGLWHRQAGLKASNLGSGDMFGNAVALDGDIAVIGARFEAGPDDRVTKGGAAYVFVRDGDEWSEKAYLKANNFARGDMFGTVVAVSGERVVVSAPLEDSDSTGIDGLRGGTDDRATTSGAVYVFEREPDDGAWVQTAYVKAANTGRGDFFGDALAVSGSAVIVGAHAEASASKGTAPLPDPADNSAFGSGAVYVFDRPAETLAPIASIARSQESVRVVVPRSIGRRIGIEYSPDLSPGTWDDIGNFFEVGTDAIFIDPDVVRVRRPNGFYRAFLREVP